MQSHPLNAGSLPKACRPVKINSAQPGCQIHTFQYFARIGLIVCRHFSVFINHVSANLIYGQRLTSRYNRRCVHKIVILNNHIRLAVVLHLVSKRRTRQLYGQAFFVRYYIVLPLVDAEILLCAVGVCFRHI